MSISERIGTNNFLYLNNFIYLSINQSMFREEKKHFSCEMRVDETVQRQNKFIETK